MVSSLASSFVGERNTTVNGFKDVKYKKLYAIEDSCFAHDDKDIVALLNRGYIAIKSIKDERIKLSKISFIMKNSVVNFYNSKGKHFIRSSEHSRLSIGVIASEGNKNEVASNNPGAQKGFSYFINEINIEDLALKTAKTALSLLSAKECPSGKMPVIIGNGWGGVLFHEACGHPLEASAVAKNLSPFANRLGQQIASPLVSAVDDSTIPGAWGSIDIDDEGNVGEKRLLIKNGILNSYLVDEFNGNKMNAKANGASRRMNYSLQPTSRMSNTYICAGKSSKEDIIKATKLGLYAVGFNGGSVNPATGEFNFACSEAYIVRNGKICELVRGATLVGKSEEILLNIDMVGDDLALGDGMCGAESGSIPVCVGQPTLRVKEINVGGRGGSLQ